MSKNLFIVIEGIDGSGKSEIVKMLHNYLFSKKKFRILTTREPTSGVYGKRIRSMLREEKNPETSKKNLLELFVKDREEHISNTITPFLSSKSDELHIAICDRYYYSNIAFQNAQGIPVEDIIKKNAKFPKPDVTFILDVSPDMAIKRIGKRQKEKFENVEFMGKIRQNFLNMKNFSEDDIIIIDASKNIKIVLEEIIGKVEKILVE